MLFRGRNTTTAPGALMVLLSAVAFGLMPVFAKLAYAEGVNLNTLLAIRFSLASASIWAIWAVAGRRTWARTEVAAGRGAGLVLPLVALGALGYVGQSFSYFTALNEISASATGLLLYTYPIMVTLLAFFVYREPLTRRKLFALALASVGALLVLGIVSSLLGMGGPGLGALRPSGVAWALAAAAVYSLYIIAGTRLTRDVSPLFASAIIITSAAAVYLLWGALSGTLRFDFAAPGWAWALAIALVSTTLAITAFFVGLPETGPSRAAIISTLEPAVTVFSAALVLGESVSPEQLLGGAFILVSVLVLQYRARQVSPQT
ncbi:MAG TPA: DMT family transporter [Chloroflexia bacterium]|nr:DMT family transporter [Chloroflexia bacterium]